MLPLRIIFDIYIIKLRMWRDGSRLAAVCLGRWKFVGPRRSSLHSVRFGQLLVTLCARQRIVNVMKVYIERNNYTSLHLWLSRVTRDHEWTNG